MQIEVKQQASNDLKKAARAAALSSWNVVEQQSLAEVAEARRQAAAVVAHSIGVGTDAAVRQKRFQMKRERKLGRAASMQPHGSPQRRLLKKCSSLSPKNGSPSARQRAKRMWALIRKRVIPVLLTFHDRAWRRRTVFTDKYLNPATDMDHPRYKSKGKFSLYEVQQQVETRRKRSKMEEVMRLHRQREEERQQERLLRLQMIREQKAKKERDALARKQEELAEKARIEKTKHDFLRRVGHEQSERAKVVNQARGKMNKVREEREAQRRLTSEKEAAENKMMYAEDTRFFHNLEKVRKQRLREYADKRKELGRHRTERDEVSGPGHLSARGKASDQELTQQQIAQEEERRMHVYVSGGRDAWLVVKLELCRVLSAMLARFVILCVYFCIRLPTKQPSSSA